jgi:hypothetical protein
MSESTDKTPGSSVDRTSTRLSKGEGPMPSLAADRLYQLAALTAGIFLLATMF